MPARSDRKRPTNAPPGSFAFSGHDRTHAHMIEADPSGRFVLHVDLGLDRIFVWKFDAGTRSSDSRLIHPLSRSHRATGRGISRFTPTDAGATPSRRKARTSSCSTYDAATGRLASRQTISSLPPGFAGSNFCSEIMVSSDGRFVYAGNRLHDSIGIFSVGTNGALDLRRRGMDPRQLSAQLQFRSHRPVPLLLQSAGRQRRGLPRGSRAPAACISPATTPRSAIRRSSCSSTL